MRQSTSFSPDYVSARRRFREAAARLGWTLEAHPIDATGPAGEELTVDVAASADGEDLRTLVVSSGVHGVEGFLGSAVQVAILERWATHTPPPIRCVFLHGLNPYGFAWLRRFDENNVDPNRNFLLPGQRYAGAPEGYAHLDALLNPRRPPSRFDPFLLRALWAVARQGMPALKQAIATGQYEFPQGLFFGGSGPSPMQRLLAANLERWLGGSRQVAHLDFHTGLGRKGDCKLLIDYSLNEHQRRCLTEWFGAGTFEDCAANGISYAARGGLGGWCVHHAGVPDYLFACAEFGTYGPLRIVAGLRAENQGHQWGPPGSRLPAAPEKQRLKELFGPSSPAWRSVVVERGCDLIGRAVRGLAVTA
jgi:hypothetical protein